MFENLFMWAQVIGFVAVGMNIAIWQIKKPKHIIAAYIPTNILWTIQYLMIGGMIGVIVSLLTALRDCSFLTIKEKHHNSIIIYVMIIAVTLSFYQFKSFYDVLPIIGIISFNIGFFFKENRALLARSSLINSFVWLIYCAYLMSIPGMLSSIFCMASVLIGMARHEKWDIGKCYKSFIPNISRALFAFPKPQIYP